MTATPRGLIGICSRDHARRYQEMLAFSVFWLCLAHKAIAQNETTSDAGLFDDPNIPVAVITIAVLAFCIIAGFVVAKLVDHCHDRQAIRDDASDISEYTKELLRAQLFLAFTNRARRKRKKGKEKPEDIALRLGLIWKAKAAAYKAKKMKDLRERKISRMHQEGDVNINTAEPGEDVQAKWKGDTNTSPSEKQSEVTPKSGDMQQESAKLSDTGKGSPVKTSPGGSIPGSNTRKTTNAAKSFTTVEDKQQKLAPVTSQTQNEVTKAITRSRSPLQSSYVDYRGDSDELAIPVRVSTDEAVKPSATYRVESETASIASSRGDYEFLKHEQSTKGLDIAKTGQLSEPVTNTSIPRPTSSKAGASQTKPGATGSQSTSGAKFPRPQTGAKPLSASPSRPPAATGNRPPTASASRPSTAGRSTRSSRK